MFAKERRAVVQALAEEEKLSQIDTICLTTSVDAMSLDVRDLGAVAAFEGVIVVMKSGKGLHMLPNGDLFRIDHYSTEGKLIDPAKS